MEYYPINTELRHHWSLLSPVQRKALSELIRAFLREPENNYMVQEPEAVYETSNILSVETLQQLSFKQKESLVVLAESFGVESLYKPMSLEEYNKELDEAAAAINRSRSYTQQELSQMTKEWLHAE